MLDQSRHSGALRSQRLHAGFCARCMSVSGPYWLASLLVYVMHAVVCVLRYSWSFLYRIIKKLHHQVITFTGLVKVAKLIESRSCGSTNLRSKYWWPSAPLFSIDLYRLAF